MTQLTSKHSSSPEDGMSNEDSQATAIVESRVKQGLQVSRVSPWLVPLVYAVGQYLVLPLYFRRVEVLGQEWLPKSGPIILAPTHRSRWDALMLPFATGIKVTGRNLRFMVSMNEVKGIQGWFIRRLGGFPIDTLKPGIASLRHSIELLQQGEMIVIFPEGNIFRDRSVQPLKAGFARLALQADAAGIEDSKLGVQVVPVSLTYSDRLVPWRSRVQIRIGKPLEVHHYCTGKSKQDAKVLTEDLRNSLQTMLTESCEALDLSQP
jgi:1-acyl-sn-glycerol-3-phosphate acyltransferase